MTPDIVPFDPADIEIGFGGDDIPPRQLTPYARFIEKTSKAVEEGAKPFTYVSSLDGTVLNPPFTIRPLYMQTVWREWPTDGKGNAVFDQPPEWQSTSVNEAIGHFPRGHDGKSMEWKFRAHMILADIYEHETLTYPLIFTFKGGSATQAETMRGMAKTKMLTPEHIKALGMTGEGIMAPLMTQLWEISLKDAKAKSGGITYKRQCLTFKGLSVDKALLEQHVSQIKEVHGGGGLLTIESGEEDSPPGS